MKTKRQALAVMSCLGGISVALAGCGGGPGPVSAHSSPNLPSARTKQAATIKLYNDKGAEDKDFSALGKMSASAIGVKVQPVGYTDENTYTALIDASFRTSDKPNVFTWHTGTSLTDVAKQGDLQSTSAIWKNAIAHGQLTKDVEKYYTVGGQQYCVPLYVSDYVMFYNKSLFAKYHLSPPSTWAQLMQIAKTLKSHKVTPFYETDVLFSFIWFEQLLIGTNPGLYNQLESGKASYTSPGVVSVMQKWRSLIQDGYMTNPAVSTAPQTLLETGAVAMIPFGTWFTGDLGLVGATPKDYGMFVIPPVNPKLKKIPMTFETGPICVAKGAPDMSADMKFMKWWTTPAPESRWAALTDDTGADPKASTPDPRVTAIQKEAASPKVQLLNRYFEATPSSVLNTALSEFGTFMVSPNTYMQDLKTIQATNKQYWAGSGH